MRPLRYVSLTIAFLLELAVLGAAGYAGFTLPDAVAVRIAVGLAAPLTLAVLWGIFAAPRASRPLNGAANVSFQIAWFGAGVVALAITGRIAAAIALAAVYAVNSIALRLLAPADRA